jgi:hypothetical protein
VLRQPYQGRTQEVTVRERGFEYKGNVNPSLSAVAKAITASRCNGYLFFRLAKAKETQ